MKLKDGDAMELREFIDALEAFVSDDIAGAHVYVHHNDGRLFAIEEVAIVELHGQPLALVRTTLESVGIEANDPASEMSS